MSDSSKSDVSTDDNLDNVNTYLEAYAEREKELTKEAIENNTFPADVDGDLATFARKRKKKWTRSKEEINLGNLILGYKAGLLKNLKRSSKSQRTDDGEEKRVKKRKPARYDKDDDELQVGEVKHTGSLDHFQKDKPYQEYVFKSVVAEPKWAILDKEDEVDCDDELLQAIGFIDGVSPLALPSTNIQYKKLQDLNRATYAEGQVNSIEFHPTSTVAMVSGLNCIATLYSVDGCKNEKLHSIRFKDFPITCAKILPCGTKAIFCGKARRFFSYDLIKATEMRHLLPMMVHKLERCEVSPCGAYLAANGRRGRVYLFDLKKCEIIHIFHHVSNSRALQFSLDSNYLISSGEDIDITVFDIRQEKVVHIFENDGCIEGRSLALSPDGRLLAAGSAEGTVNIYNYDDVILDSFPQPEKTFLNLTTAVNQLKFNHTSEMLAMCSRGVPGGVKLAHIPTGTVFANFPEFNNNLPCVQTINFSPSSGYLAMGGKSKEASLFRLNHFNNY